MNEAIERINGKIANLETAKEMSIGVSYMYRKSDNMDFQRSLARKTYEFQAQINILEELKAELEEADALAELDEMIASETN